MSNEKQEELSSNDKQADSASLQNFQHFVKPYQENKLHLNIYYIW